MDVYFLVKHPLAMLIPFGCCAPEREHFLERIFTKLEGEKAKHILLRDRFRKITCNFVMT